MSLHPSPHIFWKKYSKAEDLDKLSGKDKGATRKLSGKKRTSCSPRGNWQGHMLSVGWIMYVFMVTNKSKGRSGWKTFFAFSQPGWWECSWIKMGECLSPVPRVMTYDTVLPFHWGHLLCYFEIREQNGWADMRQKLLLPFSRSSLDLSEVSEKCKQHWRELSCAGEAMSC